MGEGNVFNLCVSPQGGTPIQPLSGRGPHPAFNWGGGGMGGVAPSSPMDRGVNGGGKYPGWAGWGYPPPPVEGWTGSTSQVKAGQGYP